MRHASCSMVVAGLTSLVGAASATACAGPQVTAPALAAVSPASSSSPTGPAPDPLAPIHIASGDFHSCALRGDGTVRCWGRNKEGQLGDRTTENRTLPVLVAGLEGVVGLALGANSSCALLRDGSVRCWGAGKAWGDGVMRTAVAPAPVSGVTGATQIDAGGLLVCARLASGGVKCWGNEGDAVAPGASAPPDRDAVEVSAAEAHACARMADGSVRCWGDSPWNGVGRPSLARPSVTGAVTITTGDSMACALLGGSGQEQQRQGTVICWGRDDQGELGRDPDNDWHPTPVTVSLPDAVHVVAGEAHVCALLRDTTVSCWGSDGDGELGRGLQGAPQLPGAVPGLRGVVELAAGADHACALSLDGTLRCWGSNAHGQLGDGTTERRTTPARVAW